MAIKSFKNKETEEIALQLSSKKTLKILPAELHHLSYKKLVFLDNVSCLQDLKAWRSLHLEKLKADRAGQWSIRINKKYRICFKWLDNHAHQVEIVDYH